MSMMTATIPVVHSSKETSNVMTGTDHSWTSGFLKPVI